MSDPLQPHGLWPESSFHGILQARILEWLAISSSRSSPWPRGWTCVSCIAGRFFTHWNTWKALTIFWSFHKLMSIESVMPSNHLTLCHRLLLPSSIFPSIRVFANESVLHTRWPKHWSLKFSISPSNEYSGQISFMMDWLDLLAVQGTLKSHLQHDSSKASIL